MTTPNTIQHQFAQYRVYLNDLRTPLTIKIWQGIDSDELSAEFSNGSKTPAQTSVYCPCYMDPEAGLADGCLL